MVGRPTQAVPALTSPDRELAVVLQNFGSVDDQGVLEQAAKQYFLMVDREQVLLLRAAAFKRIRAILAREALPNLTLNLFNAGVWQAGYVQVDQQILHWKDRDLAQQHYLETRLPGHPEWAEDPRPGFRCSAGPMEKARRYGDAWNEAQTEDEFVKPVAVAGLALHPCRPSRRSGRIGRPDYALFGDEASKDAAYPTRARMTFSMPRSWRSPRPSIGAAP